MALGVAASVLAFPEQRPAGADFGIKAHGLPIRHRSGGIRRVKFSIVQRPKGGTIQDPVAGNGRAGRSFGRRRGERHPRQPAHPFELYRLDGGDVESRGLEPLEQGALLEADARLGPAVLGLLQRTPHRLRHGAAGKIGPLPGPLAGPLQPKGIMGVAAGDLFDGAGGRRTPTAHQGVVVAIVKLVDRACRSVGLRRVDDFDGTGHLFAVFQQRLPVSAQPLLEHSGGPLLRRLAPRGGQADQEAQQGQQPCPAPALEGLGGGTHRGASRAGPRALVSGVERMR